MDHAQPEAKYTSENLPAAFWDEYPENAENHADYAAINAILEESTPDERAETYKGQGNDALKRGLQLKKKFYLREAVTLYTKGLEMGSSLPSLLSVLHSNRAQAHLILENFRSALEDSQEATHLDPANLKGYYRGARAAMKLQQYERAAEICSTGLTVDRNALELQQLKFQAEAKLQAAAVTMQREAARAMAERAPAKRLASELIQRGYQVGRPQLSVGDHKPYVDKAGLVHWPLLFVYPETMQMDAVEDASELDSLGDHLDAMFSPEAPPLEWDRDHEYTRSRLETYYLSHAAEALASGELAEALHSGWPKSKDEDAMPSPYGKHAAKWVRINEEHSLQTILHEPGHVIPGIPVFFVVASGTRYRDAFLSEDRPLM
ncbi:Tetratricopeptide repeat protein 4 [Coccomyxa sp. Obi]|nr:Tetratricopeptide repeat protein 4 [Coccomyxa sp. Obi]